MPAKRRSSRTATAATSSQSEERRKDRAALKLLEEAERIVTSAQQRRDAGIKRAEPLRLKCDSAKKSERLRREATLFKRSVKSGRIGAWVDDLPAAKLVAVERYGVAERTVRERFVADVMVAIPLLQKAVAMNTSQELSYESRRRLMTALSHAERFDEAIAVASETLASIPQKDRDDFDLATWALAGIGQRAALDAPAERAKALAKVAMVSLRRLGGERYARDIGEVLRERLARKPWWVVEAHVDNSEGDDDDDGEDDDSDSES